MTFSNVEAPKVIAEIGINHSGNLETAIAMADSAIKSGAHIIKHQTHIAKAEMSIEARKAIPGNSSKSIFEIVEDCQLSETDEFELANFVTESGGVFLSTPFSREAVDRLNAIGVQGFKIGSGECNNLPLVDYVARQGKPVILSTGMNDLPSVAESVSLIASHEVPLALMHTTNLYPTPSRLIRLGGITELQNSFPDLQIGLSDHSTSNSAAIAAVALGASFIERHYTDSKSRTGPDIPCSMDGRELQELITMTKEVWEAAGGTKSLLPEEDVTAKFAFSSLSSSRYISKGETFTQDNIWPRRPAGGDFGPKEFYSLLGKKALIDIEPGVHLRVDMVE